MIKLNENFDWFLRNKEIIDTQVFLNDGFYMGGSINVAINNSWPCYRTQEFCDELSIFELIQPRLYDYFESNWKDGKFALIRELIATPLSGMMRSFGAEEVEKYYGPTSLLQCPTRIDTNAPGGRPTQRKDVRQIKFCGLAAFNVYKDDGTYEKVMTLSHVEENEQGNAQTDADVDELCRYIATKYKSQEKFVEDKEAKDGDVRFWIVDRPVDKTEIVRPDDSRYTIETVFLPISRNRVIASLLVADKEGELTDLFISPVLNQKIVEYLIEDDEELEKAYNPVSKALIVTLDEVTVAPPNIDYYIVKTPAKPSIIRQIVAGAVSLGLVKGSKSILTKEEVSYEK